MPERPELQYDASVGRRIQAIRKQRRLTQLGLAQRANISYSTLTKVESGHAAASPTVTAACARALRVPVTDLTGQPYFDSLKQDQLEELIQPLRHAVANPLIATGDDPLRPLHDIREEVQRLDESRLRGEYMDIGGAAPTLIDELLTLIETSHPGPDQQRVYAVLAMTYRLANNFAHKLGFLDLALMAMHRMEQAAQRADDPYLPVVVTHYRSNYFLHHGAYDIALRDVGAMERLLEDPARRGDLHALSLLGTMHLKAAVLHSRQRKQTSASDVSARIAEARQVARKTAGQADPYGLIFDQVNVEVHATSTRLDLGEVGAAAEHGEREVRLPDGWALNRAGHHHMDMARAYEKIGKRESSLGSLVQARSAAPAQTRYHPTTRETVLALLRGRGAPHPELTRYARWVGV